MKRFVVAFLLALLLATPVAGEEPFPQPAELDHDVRFWTRIYTEVGTNGGFIHDSRHLDVVYETVHFPKGLSNRERERRVAKKKKHIAGVLRSLARGKRKGLSSDEKRILALWPPGVSNSTLGAAASRLRFQLGQSDKFRAGLIRSGAWIDHIRMTLLEMGLPMEISALPHVESSYTPHARSSAGAAGLWQFTRSTGRRFMRVDHVVDERLDPFIATRAAGRLLQQNRKVTGAWPLAITAYNHGASGMRRAASQLGTRDIATIVRKYKSRTFGFASRNFYVEFLAAVDIAKAPSTYFGRLHPDPPIEYVTSKVPHYTTARGLVEALGIPTGVLKQANPALLSTVWRGNKYVPKGFELRVPRSHLSEPLAKILANLPASQRYAGQTRDTFYKVRRGDTLSRIASRHRTSVSELVAINGLRSRNRIRVGQTLRLPDDGPTRVAVARPAPAPVAPPADGLYRVRRGDNLTKISQRFGVTERELLSMNPMRNKHRLAVGQVLRVAAATKTEPAASEPVQVAAVRKPTPVAVIDEPVARAPVQIAAVTQPVAPPEPEPPAPPTPLAPQVAPAAEVTLDETPEPPSEEAELAKALQADPTDYSVAADGTIQVQAAETLGHYADWLQIPTNRLRGLNRLRYGASLPLSHRVQLDFTRVEPAAFEHRRMEYHRELQESFFDSFEIAGTSVHVTRRGESLWSLAERRFRVPIWLLRQYNPDLDFEALTAGTRVTVPQIRRHDEGGTEQSTS